MAFGTGTLLRLTLQFCSGHGCTSGTSPVAVDPGQIILTVRAKSIGPDQLELTCTTMGGNIAAAVEWPIDAPSTGLPQAIVAAVESSGFDCPLKPLGVWHLCLIGQDGAKLALAQGSPSLAEQLGLELTSAPASSGVLGSSQEA